MIIIYWLDLSKVPVESRKEFIPLHYHGMDKDCGFRRHIIPGPVFSIGKLHSVKRLLKGGHPNVH